MNSKIKTDNRLIAFLLSLVVLLSTLPVAVLAADGDQYKTQGDVLNVYMVSPTGITHGEDTDSYYYNIINENIDGGSDFVFKLAAGGAPGINNNQTIFNGNVNIYDSLDFSKAPVVTFSDFTVTNISNSNWPDTSSSVGRAGRTFTFTLKDGKLTSDKQYYLVVNDISSSGGQGTGSIGKKIVFAFKIGNVSTAVKSVNFDYEELVFRGLKQTITLNATVLPETATDKSVSYKSSDEKVATVGNDGTVTSVGSGTADIVAKTNDGGFEAVCKVSVEDSDENVILAPATGELQPLTHGRYMYSVTQPDVYKVIGKSAYFVAKEEVDLSKLPVFHFAFGSNGGKKDSYFYVNVYSDKDGKNKVAQYSSSGAPEFSIELTNEGLKEGNTYYLIIEKNSHSGSEVTDEPITVEFKVAGEAAVDPEEPTDPEEPEAYETVKQFTDGNWYHAKGDEIIPGKTVAENEYGWWYCDENGKVDFDFTGLAENQYGWWYIENGKVNFNYTGIKNNEYGWWRIENGQVIFSATGVYENEYGWWYVENGKVNFDYTGIKENAYGWWRIVNGGVDFSAHGVFQNEYGWWYVNGGKVNFSYTGIASNEWGSWYIKNGQVNFDYTGSILVNKKTYKVINGQIVA